MNRINNPKVSIIIPVYNGSNYLANAIDSALAQTYKNIEVIVVNDGSKDEGATERIALSYGDRIHYYAKSNGGVSSALNFGIQKMSGDYFSWLSHDDLYEPKKIESTVNLLNEGPIGKTIAFCGSGLIDGEGKTIYSVRKEFNRLNTGSQMFCECFRNKKGLNGCTLLIPKKAFEEIGGFSELIYLQDMECWAKLMMLGYSFVYMPERLVMMRVHAKQVSNLRPEKYYEEFPIYMDRLYRFAKWKSTDSTLFLKYLLISCWQSKMRLPDFEKEISRDVHIPFLEKIYYQSKGTLKKMIKTVYWKFVKQSFNNTGKS